MDAVQTIGTILGIGFLSGIRLYATVLAIGLVLRFHWFTLPVNLSHLQVLAEPWVLWAAAAGCIIEFVADKIPWVDSAWDSFHTIIRPLGAALIAMQIFGSHSPAAQAAIALLSGGVALAGHSSKAATRIAVNHSPEPVSNIVLSLAEDALVPFGVWLALRHPIITTIAVCTFLVIFVWLARKIWRLVRNRWTSFRGAPVPELRRDA